MLLPHPQITSTFISTDLRVFATASLDGKIQVYQLATGKRIRTLFHPNSRPINNVTMRSGAFVVTFV